MCKKVWLWILMLAGLAACSAPPAMPTLMVLATQPPTDAALAQLPTATATHTTTATIALTATPTATATITSTATVTSTATPSATATATYTATLSPTATFTATPIGDAYVSGASGVNLRSGPSTKFEPPLALLETDTPLILLAASSVSDWYKVRTLNNDIGWVYGNLITMNREMPDLPQEYIAIPTDPPAVIQVPPGSVPISNGGNIVVQQPSPVPAGAGAGVVNIAGGGGGGSPGAGISSSVWQTYQTGLSRGNNPRMFIKVGDSLTAAQPFLIGFGTGEYNLGGYGSLQGTINYFDNGAFTRDSIAAEPGFNAAAILSSIWAPPGVCQPNESPLNCEIRLMRPSIALIMYGSVDVQLYSVGEFQGYLSQIVQNCMNQGVIPVLSTFPNSGGYYPGESEAFNNAIRSVAGQYQIPLIDLRPAIMGLPSQGVKADGFHLTEPGVQFIDLSGGQNNMGLTLRNRMTLQKLDELRRGLGLN